MRILPETWHQSYEIVEFLPQLSISSRFQWQFLLVKSF